jgi:hypothetical protein
VSVLMKLSGGCPKLSGQLNVDAFLDQARRYVYFNSCAYGKFV